jgi:hypothetical protein
LRRKPWAFGERAFHPLYRYSCQHSHFRWLQQTSRSTFTALRNAPLPPQALLQVHFDIPARRLKGVATRPRASATRKQRPEVCDLISRALAPARSTDKVTNLPSRRRAFHRVVVPNATTVKERAAVNELEGVLATRSFGYRLEPRYIFRAGRLDQ